MLSGSQCVLNYEIPSLKTLYINLIKKPINYLSPGDLNEDYPAITKAIVVRLLPKLDTLSRLFPLSQNRSLPLSLPPHLSTSTSPTFSIGKGKGGEKGILLAAM